MQTIFFAILTIFIGGLLTLFFKSRAKIAANIAIISNLLAGIQCLVEIYNSLIKSTECSKFVVQLITGPVSFQLDSLAAYFLLPTIILATILAIYGKSYLTHGSNPIGNHWFFYNLLTASMLGVVVSANALAFIFFWEIMSLAAFFLILHDDELKSVKNAAWTFFTASHVSTAFIFIMFAFLSSKAGSFEFSAFSYSNLSPSVLFFLFACSLIGFGTKAGFFPMHIWLPEAHPAAPSHVSALMSGAMIKTGFYALFRFWTEMTSISEIIGWIFVVGGILTGIFAIVTALGQSDIKRVMAYSSVENSGIIFTAIGMGILTRQWGMPLASACAFIGALMHILNHAIFKGLLFMGAGAVFFSSNTRKLEQLGGWIRKMPVTAFYFLLGSIAISALPPMNGFMSEFLIFFSGLKIASNTNEKGMILAVIAISGIALIGGLAIACFTRTFALVFLGEPRSNTVYSKARTVTAGMKIPMLLLAALCFTVAIFSPTITQTIAKMEPVNKLVASSPALLAPATDSLRILVKMSLLLAIIPILLFAVRRKFFGQGDTNNKPTWDCGYANPSSKMQYTSSSFSQPILASFAGIPEVVTQHNPVQNLFPEKADFKTEKSDLAMKYIVTPPIVFIDRILLPLRKFQHGKLHAYIAYIALALLILLIWKVGIA